MQAAAVVAEVGDLVAAAEAGGDDQVIRRRLTHGGEEHALAAGLAHLVVVLFVAEAASQRWSPGIADLNEWLTCFEHRQDGGESLGE